ncbi:hypothetical protein [Eremococcus coleocola]|uniref:Uncharacterized protein n=1 Tax=Eremococcus coleocola ACS-139-V-Col8 TaxID=908337 RepID=E4KQB0_9LACT|nr:hypothetical protein [Eremococcus coleocola]EFR30870.1 hypothetical protein HMPREF9257_1711 [Eremococcus coleocola ACS-139-V-Col8]
MEIIEKYKKFIILAICLGLAWFSFAVVSQSEKVNEINQTAVTALDEKKDTVLTLTALSGTTSTAITLLPGDVGGPLAENIADIADYLLIVFGGIWVQKYLLSITGNLAFRWLMPIALTLLGVSQFINRESVKQVALKVLIMAGLVFAIIPGSIYLTDQIEASYDTTIQQSIDSAQSATNQAQANEDKNIFEKITSASTDLLKQFEDALGNMVDSVAVLIVSTCVIPILVFFFFIWATNQIFKLNISLPALRVRHGFKGLVTRFK